MPLSILLALLVISCSKSSDTFINNPGAPDYLHNRATGASANELLSAAKYSSLKIEVLYMPGFAPDNAALNHLQSTLNGIVNKPAGISIATKQIAVSGKAGLSVDDVWNIEKNNRSAFTTSSSIAICIVYTDGAYTDNNVLGIAYKNTSVALFGKTIHDNSGGLGQASRTKLEATVLEHELGHLLGLVDLGSPMQSSHRDTPHGYHCNNSNCLMYYASETNDILGFLVTGNIPSFDAACRADMQANGGK